MKIAVAKIVPSATLPTRKNPTDAGLDLYSAFVMIIEPGEVKTVRTGVAVEIPKGYVGLLKPKSRHDLLVGAGVIDHGYAPGEIMVKVVNVTNKTLVFRAGDPVAQLLIMPIITPEISEINLVDMKSIVEGRDSQGGILEQMNLTEYLLKNFTNK